MGLQWLHTFHDHSAHRKSLTPCISRARVGTGRGSRSAASSGMVCSWVRGSHGSVAQDLSWFITLRLHVGNWKITVFNRKIIKKILFVTYKWAMFHSYICLITQTFFCSWVFQRIGLPYGTYVDHTSWSVHLWTRHPLGIQELDPLGASWYIRLSKPKWDIEPAKIRAKGPNVSGINDQKVVAKISSRCWGYDGSQVPHASAIRFLCLLVNFPLCYLGVSQNGSIPKSPWNGFPVVSQFNGNSRILNWRYLPNITYI